MDNVCGAGCFHGFHADLSRTFAFRVEDKKTCEPTFCASGVKFNDANGNGLHDSGETGIPGVEIHVGDFLEGLTGPDGSFQICGLTDGGAFRVSETVPNGRKATGPTDRDIARHVFSRGGAYIIEVCVEDISALDFGNQALPNAIGGFKFEDLNANGARDSGEPGLAGVTIVLTVAGGSAQRTTARQPARNRHDHRLSGFRAERPPGRARPPARRERKAVPDRSAPHRRLPNHDGDRHERHLQSRESRGRDDLPLNLAVLPPGRRPRRSGRV